MTTLAPPTPAATPASARPRALDRVRVRTRADEAAWVLPATVAVMALAGVLYLVNLTVSGYANVYYSGAAWAAAQSWAAWFQGSIDPATFITVDKPPLSTMVMGLSVRVFGLSSASLLVPEALMGVATVGLLMATARRTFGAPASIIAGLVMALTPAAVLIFRYNNPDALLTLLLVGAAYAFVRGLERDRLRWVALAGVLVGLAFNTKLLQAYLVLPAFAITFALCAPGSIRRRVVGLTLAAVAVVVASSWWVAAMELIPASARAYIGGSTGNSALDLVLGYDGLGRIFGQGGGSGGPGGGGPGGGGPGGGGFSGTPGILRLFNSELGGQVAWFLPTAVVGLVAGLASRLRAPRTDLARAGFLMWGIWLAVHAVVFSFMSGVIHSYYVVAMAPAVGALVGGGVVAIWRARERHPWAGFILGLTLFGTATVAWMLLDRTPDFVPGLGIAALAVTGIALPILTLRPAPERARAQLLAATLGVAVLLAGPAAYAISTMGSAYSGGDPSAGPAVASGDGGFGGGRMAMGQAPAGMGGMGGPGGGASLGDSTLAYLAANQGDAAWLVAVSDASTASQLELATGRSVMSTGGFTGSDAALTLDTLRSLVADGRLRFIVTGDARGGGPGGASSTSEVSAWVTTSCTAVTVDGSTTSVYDCGAVVTG